VATQPYDKISPELQDEYHSRSPYNFVRIILGERFADDNETNNVYVRSTAYFHQWIANGILVQEEKPSLFVYFQTFEVPDTGESLVRKGFIGLAQVEDYDAKVVFRHEQTLSGPKKDRMELLKHTDAHLEQLFLMYPDPKMEIDAILDSYAQGEPAASVEDDYGCVHTIWKIDDPATIERIQQIMADKKLVIADGHHRYETALNFAKANPDRPAAQKVMMTFVNIHSPGLRILAAHRVLGGLAGFDPAAALESIRAKFSVDELSGGPADVRRRFDEPHPEMVRIGLVLRGDPKAYLVTRPRQPGELDLHMLHQDLIEGVLGVTPDSVRDQKVDIRYVRGMDNAVAMVREGNAQVAFLVQATTVQEVADISFAGGVMPQKSTDFYPKLLSGLTIYKLED
jgi:uncharacterized protein (DUF1015 family)